MIRLSRTELKVDADTALDIHLHARIAAAPGQLPGAPLPSDRALTLVLAYIRARPIEARKLAAARAWRRHRASLIKAPLN